MNPLDLPGPQFLVFYVVTLIIAIIIAILLRRRLVTSGDDFTARAITVDPYEAAYLRGGSRQVIETAVAMLVQSKVLKVSKGGREISKSGPLSPAAHKIEQSVYKILDSKPGRNMNDVVSSALLQADVDRLEERLKNLGLVLSDERWQRARRIPALVILIVFLLATAKIAVGVSRNRPVGILVFLCILTGIIALIFLSMRPGVTPLGKTVLKQLRHENAALETTARTEPQHLAHGDVALALGLFGITALGFADDSWSDMRKALQPPPSSSSGASFWSNSSSSSSSSCSSSSCSSSSSSSCGSSCGGGCGGGGCGGCGS